MWFIYSLLGAFITGIGQVLVKKGQIKLTPLLDNLLATLIVNLILVPILIFYGVVDLSAWQSIVPYAFIVALMYATFYYVISFGNVSLMISLINASPVVTILLAVAFLHELPNAYQWFGILLIGVGSICIGNKKWNEDIVINKKKMWVLWGILGAVAIGFAEFVTKLATIHTDGFTFTFFVYVMYIPPLLLFMLLDKKGRKFEKLENKKSLIYTLIGIFFIEAGLIAIALAYQNGQATLVAPVVATHLLITAVLAVMLLKEKLTSVQKVGIALNLIGISFIGFWS